MNKSAADVLEGLNTYDACVQEVDNFIDGVESGIKAAGLSDEKASKVWEQIGTVLEKAAAPVALEAKSAPDAVVGAVPKATLGQGLDAGLAGLKNRFTSVDWKAPGTWQRSALGAGVGALGGVLGTAALAKKDKEGRKPYLRNALLAGLAGAGAAPYAVSQQSMDSLANKATEAGKNVAGKLGI